MIESESKIHIANAGAEPSSLWLALIGIIAPSPGLIYGLIDQPIPAGVDVTRLVWSTEKIEPPAPEKLRLRVARVTVPPGSRFLVHQAGLGESLAVVDGALEATVYQGQPGIAMRMVTPPRSRTTASLPPAKGSRPIREPRSRTGSRAPPPPRCSCSPPPRRPPECRCITLSRRFPSTCCSRVSRAAK